MNNDEGILKLSVYKDSLILVKSVYTRCSHPAIKNEQELTRQIKRAVLSIPANISEGYGRKTNKDFSQFISIALGSANEVVAFLDCIQELFPQHDNSTIRAEAVIVCKKLYKLRLKLVS